MSNNKYRNRQGFTMIEMMIVIVVIGIMAAMAAPSFLNWIPKMKLKNDAREKVNYLRQARSRAIAENSQYGVFFDLYGNRMHFFKDTDSPEWSYYAEGADSLIENPVSNESNVSYGTCSLMGNTVIFYPNGSASTSGSIELYDIESGNSYTINVLASTGRIRLQ